MKIFKKAFDLINILFYHICQSYYLIYYSIYHLLLYVYYYSLFLLSLFYIYFLSKDIAYAALRKPKKACRRNTDCNLPRRKALYIV